MRYCRDALGDAWSTPRAEVVPGLDRIADFHYCAIRDHGGPTHERRHPTENDFAAADRGPRENASRRADQSLPAPRARQRPAPLALLLPARLGLDELVRARSLPHVGARPGPATPHLLVRLPRRPRLLRSRDLVDAL